MATQKLTEYIIKGFVLDDERLKNPDLPFDYFEELTRRIQDIRTSEKRFYRKITDIYALSLDYDPTDVSPPSRWRSLATGAQSLFTKVMPHHKVRAWDF